MFGKTLIGDMITRSAENATDRRNFMRAAGLSGLGVIGAGAAVTGTAGAASASDGGGVSDAAVLNFALNLEYLEAEFYSYAAFGKGLDDGDTDGKGHRGAVTGGSQVKFTSEATRQYAEEIAYDEIAHVRFLRRELGSAAVARPKIDLVDSFTAAARAAGLRTADQVWNPFEEGEDNFLLAAFLFEDVGVTAYKGAAPLISNKTYLEAAAGILAVEAYHAATVRTLLLGRDLGAATNAISDARDSLDGKSDLDKGALMGDRINITPVDDDAIAFSRSPGQVLNIVYLNPDEVEKGGFFPDGVNGDVRKSA